MDLHNNAFKYMQTRRLINELLSHVSIIDRLYPLQEYTRTIVRLRLLLLSFEIPRRSIYKSTQLKFVSSRLIIRLKRTVEEPCI